MRTIKTQRHLSPQEEEQWLGVQLDESSYDTLLQDEDVQVLKPDGTTLLVVKARALSPQVCSQAYPALRKAVAKTDNRGAASGTFSEESFNTKKTYYSSKPIGLKVGKTRIQFIKKDGTISDSDRAYKVVESGLMGYYDRHSRFPFCRQTAFTAREWVLFRKTLPFLRTISNVFKDTIPDRYVVQQEMCTHTHPDFVIPGTVFTTVTVNRNWPTAVHTDKGDLRGGFGVMSAIRAGKFDGCYFVFPTYRVAVNLKTTDILFADVHEIHGNTPLRGIRSTYERISCVLYYREKMIHCLSAEEELKRAQQRQLGDPLNA